MDEIKIKYADNEETSLLPNPGVVEVLNGVISYNAIQYAMGLPKVFSYAVPDDASVELSRFVRFES